MNFTTQEIEHLQSFFNQHSSKLYKTVYRDLTINRMDEQKIKPSEHLTDLEVEADRIAENIIDKIDEFESGIPSSAMKGTPQELREKFATLNKEI